MSLTFSQIEESYHNYLEIEPYLSDKDRLNYLRGFQELIKLYKLSVELEAVEETM